MRRPPASARRAEDRLGRVAPEALFIVGAVSQYLGAAIAVTLFDEIDARGVAWLRVVGAAALLVAWRRPWRRRWTRHQLALAAAFGTVLTGMNLSFYLAIDRLDLGTAVAIEFLGPIAVAAVGTRTRRSATSLGLAAAGVVLLAEVQAEGSATGVALALTAAALWAGYIVLGSLVARSGTSVDGLGLGMVVGAAVIAPFCVGAVVPVADRPGLLVLGLATGLLSSVIPYALDQVVLARLHPSRFALLLALLPVTATVVGVVFLGQVPSVAEAAGIALVVLAIASRERSGEVLAEADGLGE